MPGTHELLHWLEVDGRSLNYRQPSHQYHECQPHCGIVVKRPFAIKPD
ncbi:MAG: hypothetical protein F6K19_26355 [Cyanothece sp. SIO1E1]|nr:hypothetical protein [Cyanothece sp. SIO1E1]